MPKFRVNLTHFTLGQIHQQNLIIIHDFPDIEPTLGLAQDVFHQIP